MEERHRPFVVSPPGAVEAEMDIIQQKIPVPPAPPVSGTGCLNLNITGPHKSASDLTVGLPVLAYLHGGGYHIGGNWWPQYDFRRLVTFGVEMGAPFIGVNIAYAWPSDGLRHFADKNFRISGIVLVFRDFLPQLR